jgi:FtsZ-interacting cell division protein ZipA
MDVGVIVAIIVVAVVLIALVAFAIPRARRAREKRQLEKRRDVVVERHREVAEDRGARADLAEREAAHRRAEAELHEARARVHERGLADDELRKADDPEQVVHRRETFVDRDREPDQKKTSDDDRVERNRS